MQRRNLIVGGAAIASAPFVGVRAQSDFLGGDASGVGAQVQGFWDRPRWLWLKRATTGEQIKVVYWKDGHLLEDGYRQASWLLRDVRFQAMLGNQDPRIRSALDRGVIQQQHLSPWVLMDPVLLDILYAFCAWLNLYGVHSPLLVTSGFRHLITNAITEGAARDSWHVRGGAGDIVVPGVKAEALAKFGQWLSGGGVGLYVQSNFIHVDRGRVRSWRG